MDNYNSKKNALLNKLKHTKEEDVQSSNFIKKHSEDWRFIEFLLKSNIPYDVEIKKALCIYNSHMKTSFEKISKNKLTTYVWISVNNLSSTNQVTRLKHRGRFDVPLGGIDFIYGSLFDDYSSFEAESSFILCKIAIGKSFCKILRDKNEMLNYNADNNQKNLLPEGYESIMFCPLNAFNINNTSYTNQFYTGKNTARYRIYDASKILPMYFINFVSSAHHINSFFPRKICKECEEKDAELYCLNCEANLCVDCNNNIHYIHSNDRIIKDIYANHRQEKINKQVNGQCDCSFNKEAEYYCRSCNLSLCSYCKLLGSHSKGSNKNHVIEDINSYYTKCHPENLDSIKLCNEMSKKASDTINKLKMNINLLREPLYLEASNQLDIEVEKEYTRVQLFSTESIHLNVTKLNLLMLLKDNIDYFREYFNYRLEVIKDIYISEFFFILFSYASMINKFYFNYMYLKSNNKMITKEDQKISKFNEFKIISFNFEDGTTNNEKEKQETNKMLNNNIIKQVFDKHQQKHNQNNSNLVINMIKIHNEILNRPYNEDNVDNVDYLKKDNLEDY